MSNSASSEVMETRAIGSLKVSVVGLGCNNLGWKIDQQASQRLIDAALDAGITLFDTADIYGQTESETFLGKALGKRRGQAVIASKFGMPVDEQRSGGAKPAYIRKALEGSLKRLQSDHVDLYYLHRPDPDTPIADTLGALGTLKGEGKIREYACSNFDARGLVEAREAAQGDGFVAVQNEYSLLHREPESSGVLETCLALQMALIPYFPLKSGLLTGKYRKDRQAPEGSRLDAGSGHRFSAMAGQLLTEANLDVVERLIAFARNRHRTILELAFSWLLSKTPVASVIAGATRPEQIQSNVSAAGWRLTADELAELDTIAPANEQ
jgi:aryl-alcohol dehydrogenase-like predicted oxidoreductase